jgi:hypothetical protein
LSKSKKKLKFIQLYTSDWRSDPCLRMCSIAARGLWIEMMCLMNEAEPYGHLIVNGVAPNDTQLSMLTATPGDQLPDLIAELEAQGVFSRNGKGVIYSRRMTRDEKQRRISRQNGRNGGNPTLLNEREKSTQDNPNQTGGLNLGLKVIDQSPETITPLNPPKGGNTRPARQQVRFDEDVGVSPDVESAYLEHRRKKKAPPTAHAMGLLSNEIRKIRSQHSFSADQIVNHAILRNWTAFKASWDWSDLAGKPVNGSGFRSSKPPPVDRFAKDPELQRIKAEMQNGGLPS